MELNLLPHPPQSQVHDNPNGSHWVDPDQCGGRPCVRGLRIRVSDVLDLLANGLTPAQIIEELPDLELADVQAWLGYASHA